MNAARLEQWLSQRGEKDDLLYERFGRPLEPEHHGEFVAIADDGRVITGPDQFKVAQQAMAQFGRGAFALRRVGGQAEMSWRSSTT